MNKNKILGIISLVAILGLFLIPNISAQSDDSIPSWIKGVANFWVEGGIDDTEFIAALEFLIDNSIIKLGENVVVDNTMSELQEENTLLKEKLEVSEANRVAQSQSDAAQHEKLYAEVEAEREKLKIKFERQIEQKGEKYRQVLQELEEELQELKKQLKWK